MIKRKYVISSSLNMSKKYVVDNRGVGYTPITFKQLVMDLYNSPIFIMDNIGIELLDSFQEDLKLCRLIKNISTDNYFYDSFKFMGSRSLIIKAIKEIRVSINSDASINMELPDSVKSDSLKEIYELYYAEDIVDYSYALNEVLSRIEKGDYKTLFVGIELIILDKPNLIGYEKRLYELFVSSVTSVIKSSEISDDYSKTFCISSITPKGNVNHLFKWMKEKSITTDNTSVVLLDYDKYAIEFYNLKDSLPVNLLGGLACKELSLFETFMTGLAEKREVTRIESWLRAMVAGSETSALEKIFYEKVLAVIKKVEPLLSEYKDLSISVDAYELIIDEVEKLRFTQSELGMEKAGLYICSLEDIYAIDCNNIAILGLNHGNYPKRVKLDPILKKHEREMINSTTGGDINLSPSILVEPLETLLSFASGFSFLSYESHDMDSGKLAVPSAFFNKILAFENMPLKVEEVYKLCSVKDGYLEDLESQGEFLNISSNSILENKINHLNDKDYGEFSEIRSNLSSSSLETFYKCPYSYHLRYNMGIKPQDLNLADSSSWLGPMERGSFLHGMYEELLKPFIGGVDYEKYLISIDDSRLEEVFNLTMESGLDKYTKFSEYNFEIPAYIKNSEIAELKENLREFLNKEIDGFDGFYPVALEKKFEFHWQFSGKDILFKGFIDRIDRDINGNYRVFDYKTGKNSFELSSGYLFYIDGGKYADKFYFQHAFYSKALTEISQFDDINSIIAGYYFSSDKGGWSKVTYSGEEPITKLKEIIDTYVQEAKTGKFFKNPTQCRFCGYKSICSNRQMKKIGDLSTQIEKLTTIAGATNA